MCFCLNSFTPLVGAAMKLIVGRLGPTFGQLRHGGRPRVALVPLEEALALWG